jgi:hypothetical protein
VHEGKNQPFGFWASLGRLIANFFWILVDWGTGYGVKPFRITLLAAVTIVSFAWLYYVITPLGTYPNYIEGSSTTKVFFDWLYFSAMTFATSSPEGDIAYNNQIKFFIMTEALLGVFLMALFVACYTRKILR